MKMHSIAKNICTHKKYDLTLFFFPLLSPSNPGAQSELQGDILSIHPDPVHNRAYKFDTVVFNDGNAYNPILGVFTAPYSGVYTFTFQIFTHLAERAIVDIRVNGNIISRMGLDTVNQSVQSDSTSVTAKLVAGDKVWVEAGSANALDIYGPNHTFFSGALLFVS